MHNTFIQQIGEPSQEVMRHLHNCFIIKATAEAKLEQIKRNDTARNCVCKVGQTGWPWLRIVKLIRWLTQL